MPFPGRDTGGGGVPGPFFPSFWPSPNDPIFLGVPDLAIQGLLHWSHSQDPHAVFLYTLCPLLLDMSIMGHGTTHILHYLHYLNCTGVDPQLLCDCSIFQYFALFLLNRGHFKWHWCIMGSHITPSLHQLFAWLLHLLIECIVESAPTAHYYSLTFSPQNMQASVVLALFALS